MKKFFQLLGCISLALASFGQTATTEIAIIPEPVLMTKGQGQFVLPARVEIAAGDQAEVKRVAGFLKERLSTATGIPVSLGNNTAAAIKLLLNTTANAAIGKEGYQLSVTPQNVIVKANEPAGLFYGVQTLLQLFPKEIESKTQVGNINWIAPCVEITDHPRFGWRGLMFDVARHFFTKEDVMRYIDDMVRYKYNLLHLHLTDDEGWRIEIKSLPRLTEVGAWNVRKEGSFGSFTPATADEPRDYGGFYTQDDIRELVQYAKDRFVNIMPEIDVPGHSLAAVVSYPDLSCTPGADKYQVRSGEPIMNWSEKPFSAIKDNTLCPANEKVYVFLDKVITELADLFPFEYIHVGGDECAKNFWEKSDAVKALMKKEGLKNMHEVQSYFEKRLQKIVTSKGKKFLGWDEILEGGLAEGAVVMSWRGIQGGIDAAKLGHEVVMSPTTFTYIDYMQGDAVIEPPVYDALRLSKSYQFEPVPDGVDAKLIKGGQANLWTEQVYNLRHAQYMTWPRALAVSESVWSPKEKKNWNKFFAKVENHFERLDMAETKYAPSVYEPIFTFTAGADKKLSVKMESEAEGLDIYYSFDNSFPDRFYPKYSEPLTPPKDATQLRVITYKGQKPVGRIISFPVEEMKKRIGKKK